MRLSLVLFVTTAIASPADFRPTFVSEVLVPKAAVILPLLKVVCDEGVRTVTPEGDKAFGCGDGAMGHSIHALYTVDFTNAKTARDSIVLFADSYSEVMLGGVQKQSIEKVA